MGIYLSGLHFIDGRLWAVAETSGQIFSVNQLTGRCTQVSRLTTPGLQVGALTLDAEQNVLIAANDDAHTYIYAFKSFPKGDVTLKMAIKDDRPVECMAAHPDGRLYLYNGRTCWDVDTRAWEVRKQSTFYASLSDMAFFYDHERENCLGLHMPEDQPQTQER